MTGLRQDDPNARMSVCSSQYSPSNQYEPEGRRKVLHLRRGKGFHKCISYHFVGRAVDKSNFAFLNDPSDEVEMNVDVLRTCVILMLLGERDRRLIVGE